MPATSHGDRVGLRLRSSPREGACELGETVSALERIGVKCYNPHI